MRPRGLRADNLLKPARALPLVLSVSGLFWPRPLAISCGSSLVGVSTLLTLTPVLHFLLPAFVKLPMEF
jgi:hypothetical protein